MLPRISILAAVLVIVAASVVAAGWGSSFTTRSLVTPGAVSLTATTGNLTLTSTAGTAQLTATAGEVDLTAGTTVDVNATTTVTVDATTSCTISAGTTLTLEGASGIALNDEVTFLASNEAIVATDTLTAAETGKVITDHGYSSGDAWTVTLPSSPPAGTHFCFTRSSSVTWWINPGASTAIIYAGGNKMDDDEDLSLATVGAYIHLMFDGADYVSLGEGGTLTEASP